VNNIINIDNNGESFQEKTRNLECVQ